MSSTNRILHICNRFGVFVVVVVVVVFCLFFVVFLLLFFFGGGGAEGGGGVRLSFVDIFLALCTFSLADHVLADHVCLILIFSR